MSLAVFLYDFSKIHVPDGEDVKLSDVHSEYKWVPLSSQFALIKSIKMELSEFKR